VASAANPVRPIQSNVPIKQIFISFVGKILRGTLAQIWILSKKVRQESATHKGKPRRAAAVFFSALHPLLFFVEQFRNNCLHPFPFNCTRLIVKFLACLRQPDSPGAWVVLLVFALFTGCGNEGVQVYRVSKETSSGTQGTSGPNPAADSRSKGLPALQWKLPSGWEEKAPGEMRLASFRVTGPESKTADVGVFPLPGMAGGDLDNVNRWRGQVGLPPISEDERRQTALAVAVDSQPAQVYEMAGQNPGSGEKTRILAAILRKDGVAWFFKMTGDDSLVENEKGNFVEWLKSLKFTPTAGAEALPPSHPPIDGASMAAQAPSAPESGAKPGWEVPSNWQEVAAGQFLVAKFNIAGADNSAAAVNVSMSPGDGGGLDGNVNRWRRQLGLAELPAGEVAKAVTELTVSEGKATLVDLAGAAGAGGQKTRILGAIVTRGSNTWFYKLMGADQTVEREKNNFLQFVKTARYPNA
jgi:hypothetical protein